MASFLLACVERLLRVVEVTGFFRVDTSSAWRSLVADQGSYGLLTRRALNCERKVKIERKPIMVGREKVIFVLGALSVGEFKVPSPTGARCLFDLFKKGVCNRLFGKQLKM